MLTLASGSPRRRLLLEQLGYRLRILPADIDETPRAGEDPLAYAERMAHEKALTADGLVVAADTVVHRDGAIFHKPEGVEDAVQILLGLSGGVHQVSTGSCVRWGDQQRLRVTTTRVRFRSLTEQEVRGYVATGEPMDKAGAYGIQGIGGFLVSSIEGSYSNVVGLPLAEVLSDLASLGAPAPFSPELSK
ncbi:MAG: Maf family protein [Myxococcota bacterium]|nr:Maf family protein [Myxococcota bacterium]